MVMSVTTDLEIAPGVARKASTDSGGVFTKVVRRMSLQSADQEPITVELFKKKAFLPQQNVEHEASNTDGSLTSNLLPLPLRGFVSISTAFVFIFVLFVTLLGASLMIVSSKYSAETNALSSRGTDSVQAIYSELVQYSTANLVNASNNSVGTLTELISKQVNKRIHDAASTYTSQAQLVVQLMSDMTEAGDLDPNNLDTTAARMWLLNFDFPTVEEIAFCGAERGDWIVLFPYIKSPPFLIAVRKTSGSSCRYCLPDDSLKTYMYAVPNASDRMTWTPTGQNESIDPRDRPWYQNGMTGNGAGVWSNPFVYVGPVHAIAITAAKLARGKNGQAIGVVGAALTISGMSSFLQQLKAEADTIHNRRALGDEGFQLALIHEQGNLLATSTGTVLSTEDVSLTWQEALNASTLRTALAVVSDYWGGDFIKFFKQEQPGNFQTYPHDQLFIMTMYYTDTWGLRMMLLSAVPQNMYRQQMDDELAATVARINHDTQNASSIIAVVRSQVADTVSRNWMTQLIISIAVLGSGAVIVFLFAIRISRTLRTMASEMQRVAMLDFSDRSMYRSRLMDEIIAINRSFAIMDMNLLSFSRYVPENVVRLLTQKGTVAHLGVAPRDVSIMFSDIVGFTTIAEELSPESLSALLAQYLEAMSDCIEESGGTVGKYIGDAIMAFWNSPTTVVDHPNITCACALEQQRRLAGLRQRWEAEGLPCLHIRIGLSTGTALHGNVGSEKRMEWTLIGDEVNLASRLEAMGKQYGVNILISGAMYDKVHGRFLARPVDRVVAMGKRQSVEIYELVTEHRHATPEQRRYCQDFAKVVEAYRRREFETARAMAVVFEEAFPGDVTARKYVQRCDHFLKDAPAEDWDGTFVLTSK